MIIATAFYPLLADLALLAVLVGIFFLLRSILRKKGEAVFLRWRPWLIFGLVIAFVFLGKCLSPIWKEMNTVEYAVSVDGIDVEDKENTTIRIEGDTTVMIVDYKAGSNEVDIVPKSAARGIAGKLLPFSQVRMPINKAIQDGMANVLCYGDTEEYYITITIMTNGDHTVSDNRGSTFLMAETYLPEWDTSTYNYYAYIGDLDESYVLTIDGTEIQLR